MNKKCVLIFPAFITGFTGKEVESLKACGGGIERLLHEASVHTGLPLSDFDIELNNFLDDELKTQYITYIFSCAFADMLKERGIYASCGAGYSMGIYAALYYAGSISFLSGLDLIAHAFSCIRTTLAPGSYAMGVTGGLDEKDILQLLEQFAKNTVLINSNSPYSFVFSGPRDEVIRMVDAAREEGALQARVMDVSIPYHSPHLNRAADCFRLAINEINITNAENNVLSAVDQRRLVTEDDIRTELVHNIHLPFHWHKTIKYFLSDGINIFIECGAGESLTKINKFIEGEFQTYNIKSIICLLQQK